MQYRKLGNSDLHISEVSFGCMSLQPGEANKEQLLRTAFDGGINFFDTADLYDKGENECIVGRALKSIREQVIIATKVGNRWKSDGASWEWAASKEYIITAVEESLKRLETDYIDLYQLHGGTTEDPIDEIIEAFEVLKKQGKIRAYGISSIRPNLIREYVKRSQISSVMMQYSLLDRRPEESCLELLDNTNIGLLARGGFAKGLLINKSPKAYLNYSTSEVKTLQDAISNTESSISASLSFILTRPPISSAVSGIRTNDQLLSILKAIKIPISSEEIAYLENILPINHYEHHR